MPYRKKYPHKKQKRGPRKNRARYYNPRKHHSKAVITRMRGQGIADMMYVKLTYVDRIRISSVGVSYMPYVFRGNSLFDPDVTAAGHQPMYFDQYSALYEKYRVLGSSIQIDVVNDSGAAALFYVCEPNTNVSSITDLSTLYEQARSGAPKIVPIAARITSRMKKYASTRKVCGLTKPQEFDDSFGAVTTANPTNLWYWNLLFGSVDALTTVDGYFVVKIVYYCQFFDRLLVLQS